MIKKLNTNDNDSCKIRTSFQINSILYKPNKEEGDYMRLTLRQIARMRYMILEGYTVEQIATSMKVSQTTVRSYTKAERARVKKENALCY